MAIYCVKPVDAIRLRVPVSATNEETGETFNVPAGTWLVTDGNGVHSFMDDTTFRSTYEATDDAARAELGVVV